MMRVRRFPVLCAILAFAVASAPLGHLNAQADHRYWVYTLEETEDAYHLLKIYVPDGSSVRLLSFPKTFEGSLSSLMTQADIEAARMYFDGLVDSFVNHDVGEVLGRKPLVSVSTISPSPDNKMVALTVRYSVIAVTYGGSIPNWFGTSHVLIVDGDTGQYRTIWNLGFMSCEVFSVPDCPAADVVVNTPTWLPDQSALVARIYTNYSRGSYLLNLPLAIVSVDDNAPPFWVGEAQAWGVAPSSHGLATITVDDHGYALNMIDFDLSTRQNTQTTYRLGVYVVYTGGGLVYIQGYPVFLAFVSSEADGGPVAGSSTALFDASQSDPMSLFRLNIPGCRSIKAAPSNEFVVGQDRDGKLWVIFLEDQTLSAKSITDEPVTLWQFMPDGALVVQFEGSTAYEILHPY